MDDANRSEWEQTGRVAAVSASGRGKQFANDKQDSLLYLDQVYRKARESIPLENKQANEALASIFINSADIKRKLKSDGKARYLLRYARANFRSLPAVHLAAAQFELDQGDKSKCISILEKACILCPTEDNLKEAIRRVGAGFNSLQEKSQNKAFTKVAPSAGGTITPRTRSLPQRVIRQKLVLKNTGSDDDEDDDTDGNVKKSINKPREKSPRNRPLDLPPQPQLSAITEDGDSGITVETPPTDDLRQTSTTGPRFPFFLNLASYDVQPGKTRKEEDVATEKPLQQPHQQPNQSSTTNNRSEEVNQPGRTTTYSLQPQVQQPPPVHTDSHQEMSQVPSSERKNQIHVKGVNYSIIKVIGKGGSSKVYQVLHEGSKKIFAVKYVDLECADDVIIQSYKNEITVLQRLQNKDPIIKLYDYEISQSHIYLVMECGSIDLASFLRRKRVQKEDILFYWRQMLTAVQCIHDEGIIHRDLKPANFLFVEGSLKLIDFGIANSIQSDRTSVTRESQVGTLNYMSPETIQSSGDSHGGDHTSMKINCKSDVWSLGCILYYITYGKTPFQSITNTMMKLQAICNPDYKIQFSDVHDSNLVDVLKRCLVRDVKERPSIKELLDHPYVSSKTSFKDSPTPALGMTKGVVENLMSKLNTTNCTSPRSVELAMALQKYLGSHCDPKQGKEIRQPLHDVNSISQTQREQKPLSYFFPNH
ncbi:putative dual specificity protein kinase TTK isoform X2 [Apostichopus japonicus]|uniref:Putative dual specificity protein kinase TTK isoform X2 n=1 Tax=Stichopus japonicus TaxID=307972 RepID=A0A2G8L2G2_STIJA|nr:putative dual specificity protein kinase TTK isoform X2 [Apostichopus japonicus]